MLCVLWELMGWKLRFVNNKNVSILWQHFGAILQIILLKSNYLYSILTFYKEFSEFVEGIIKSCVFYYWTLYIYPTLYPPSMSFLKSSLIQASQYYVLHQWTHHLEDNERSNGKSHILPSPKTTRELCKFELKKISSGIPFILWANRRTNVPQSFNYSLNSI